MGLPHHEQAVGEEGDANQVEKIEWPQDRRVGLQEFPGETLASIPPRDKIEAPISDERGASRELPEIDAEEKQHCTRLVQLYGMAQNPVAEVDAPRHLSRSAVGVVGQSREEASKPTNRDTEREGRDELATGRASDPGERFVDLDTD